MAKATEGAIVKKLLGKTKGLWDSEFANHKDEFAPPDIPDGAYTCKLSTARLAENRNGDPYVMFTYIVAGGEYEGKQLRDMHTIAESASGKRTVKMALNILSGNLQRLGVQTTGLNSPEKLAAALDKLVKGEPLVRLTFESNQYSGNVRILGLAGQEANGTGDAPFFEAEAGSYESAAWSVDDYVEVNDPNDADSPWYGQVVEVTSDQEVEVVQYGEDGPTDARWVVRTEFLSRWTD